MKNAKRFLIQLPEETDRKLEEMSEEMKISKNQLSSLAIQSLVANYDKQGIFLFSNLVVWNEKKER